MFTGIITDVGEIVAVEEKGTARTLAVACSYPADSLPLGASVCHMGICLTVTSLAEQGNRTVFTIDASGETLARTTLGTWATGMKVNLERSLRIGDELGGHIVTGHVDGVAEIVSREDRDGTAWFVFRAPRELAKFIAEKGSVALARHLAHRQRRNRRHLHRHHDPAHPPGHHLGRRRGRRPGQPRGRHDGPLRGAPCGRAKAGGY
jgi:riboflavin synthase